MRIRICCTLFLSLVLAFHTPPSRAAAPTTTPTSRPAITTPLSGDALAKELDHRFGIWFVGGTLPDRASATLPENATAVEALSLIKETYKQDSRDFQVVPVSGSDGKVFQIVHPGDPPHKYRYGKDPANIPAASEIVTQIIPLTYDSPSWLTDDLTPFIPMGPKRELDLATAHDCVIVTDTSTNLHHLAEIIAKIDVPRPVDHGFSVDYIQLIYVDSADVAHELDRRYGSPPATSPSTLPAELPQRFHLDFDARTNTIIFLNGPTKLIDEAIALAKKMDADAAASGAKPRPLSGSASRGTTTRGGSRN